MIQQRNPVRGFLASVGVDPPIMVRFQYNPGELQDRRAVHYATLEAPGRLIPDRHYTRGGDRTISFKVAIDGVMPGAADGEISFARGQDGSITPELNKYRAFLYPATARWREAGSSFLPLYEDERQFQGPARCRFGFGSRVLDCLVTGIGITETFFSDQLAPLRAEVDVTLVEIVPYDEIGFPGGP